MISPWLIPLGIGASIEAEKKQFEAHYARARNLARGIAVIKGVDQASVEKKEEWLSQFKSEVFQMEQHGFNFMSMKDVDKETHYLHRRLYNACMETAKERFKRQSLGSFDFDGAIMNDPDVRIAGQNYFMTHFRNSHQLKDDLQEIKEILVKKLTIGEITIRIGRSHFSQAWKGLLCFLGSC